MSPISPVQECHSPLFETIIVAISDDSSDDLIVENQFLHIAKDVAMAEPIHARRNSPSRAVGGVPWYKLGRGVLPG